ncbi:LANO_0E08350g1_1 [Lachancea nothofagi CBS 11611]|uniref:LANO_0E08350g1_1 n=1 Tax=Lachancea nothofagi CBS 11611 TaxID=1266666 RepID=A0A1G4JV44_9SACH|nr:LANO_0E08350g1_1 [Lachancea nothofagi CBS 11611]
MLKSIFRRYPEPQQAGYWGKPTSTIDWCEENYVVSPFVAEWSNTITNSAFVALAMYVTWSAYYHRLEKRFVMIGIGLGTVGVGSWLFHMTLRYEYQLLDELPMIYATCIPAWSIFSEEKDILRNRNRAPSLLRQSIIGAIVFSAAAILTVVYLVYRDPTIHQTAYAILNVIVVFSAGAMASKYVRDPLAKRNLRNTMALSISIFLLGYFLWQLDVHFCSFWIFIRRTFLHLPLGVFLELHSWWHLLTGSGVYFYIVHLEYLRILTHGQAEDYTLIWRWKVFPELIHSSHTVNTKYSLEFCGPYVGPESSSKLDRSKRD